jgi:archaellum component FlaC
MIIADKIDTSTKVLGGKQDKMLEKQDETIAAIKGLDKKQDVMIDTLKGFREETKNEFQIIKTDYGRISQDLGKAVDSINRIAKSIETLAKAIAEKK